MHLRKLLLLFFLPVLIACFNDKNRDIQGSGDGGISDCRKIAADALMTTPDSVIPYKRGEFPEPFFPGNDKTTIFQTGGVVELNEIGKVLVHEDSLKGSSKEIGTWTGDDNFITVIIKGVSKKLFFGSWHLGDGTGYVLVDPETKQVELLFKDRLLMPGAASSINLRGAVPNRSMFFEYVNANK